MNLIFPKTIEGYVNHFADFLLKIVSPSNMTVVKLTFHFPNVMIIQGYNFGGTIHNFSKLHDDFLKINPEYENIIGTNKITFIDLLNDKSYKGFLDTWWFDFHNTPRPLYNSFQISEFASPSFKENITSVGENNIKIQTPATISHQLLKGKKITECQFMVSSSFPFGFSKHLRSIMYTSEFIAYNLFRIVKTNEISIYNTEISPLYLDEELQIKCKSSIPEKRLVSLVLDTLTDYDLEAVIEDYDISQDFFEPIADKPWIESWKVGELVMF